MSGPTTLREVLEQHADAFSDHAGHERISAVRRRVRRARQRRAAAVSVAAAAVLVAAGLAVVLPRTDEPRPVDAPTKMVGQTVPRTTTSYGATFIYTRGYTSATGHLEVTLPKAPRGVLVRAASEAGPGHGQLVLRSSGVQPWVVPTGGFGPFEYLGGSSRKVTLQLTGAPRRTGVALAVYVFGKHAPGYTRAGITYPESVSGRPLLAAFIGAPGEDSGTIRVPALHGTDNRRLTVDAFCSGAPKGAMIEIAAGDGPIRIGCRGPAPADAGHAASQFSARFPAHAFRARVWLTDARGRRIPVPPDGRIGAALYGRPPGAGVRGLPSRYDTAGHTWELDGAISWTRGTGEWRSTPVRATRPVLVAYGTPDGGPGSVIHARIPGSGPVANQGGGYGYAVVSNGDPRAQVRLRGDQLPPGARLVVGTYHLAD